MLPPLPSSLGVVRPYLDRSLELATAAPIVAHQLRVLAMHVALQLPRDAAARRFLTALMHQLETDAQLLGESGEAPAVEAPIRRMALDLFAKATTADKPDAYPNAGNQWSVLEAPKVAKCFHACAVVFDALRLHAALSADEARDQAYAATRSQVLSTQLGRALKLSTGIPPMWKPIPQGLLPSHELRAVSETTQGASGGGASGGGASGGGARLPTVSATEHTPSAVKPAAGASELAAEHAAERAAEAAAEAAADSAACPVGWERRKDPASGRFYYIDHVNKITSWTPPADDAAPAGSLPSATLTSPAASPTRAAVALAAAELPAETALPAVGLPAVGLPAVELPAVELPAVELPAAVPLPPGWEKRTDPTTGKTFFVNLLTKNTSWTLPADVALEAAADGPALSPATLRDNQEHDTSASTSLVESAAPRRLFPLPLALPEQPAPEDASLRGECVATQPATAPVQGTILELQSEAQQVARTTAAQMDELDAMWAAMRLVEEDEVKGAGEGSGRSREERRQVMREERAKLRAVAVQNVLAMRHEVEEITTAAKAASEASHSQLLPSQSQSRS
mgnify:FL=1